MRKDPSGSTRVGRFDVDVQVRGHDKDGGVKTYGYTLRPAPGDAPDVVRMSMSENGFVPRGDFTVEYALPGRNTELTAWAYRPDGKAEALAPASSGGVVALASAGGSEAPYVALALRPKLPRWVERLTVALCWPLMRRYGYPLGSGGAGPSGGPRAVPGKMAS